MNWAFVLTIIEIVSYCDLLFCWSLGFQSFVLLGMLVIILVG